MKLVAMNHTSELWFKALMPYEMIKGVKGECILLFRCSSHSFEIPDQSFKYFLAAVPSVIHFFMQLH